MLSNKIFYLSKVELEPLGIEVPTAQKGIESNFEVISLPAVTFDLVQK